MLTDEEIKFWEPLIFQSEDLDIARKFYRKTGRPEKAKEAAISAVRHFANYDILLQQKFEEGAFKPELTDDEVRQIASQTVQTDTERGGLGDLLSKLDYPVYSNASIPDEEMSGLVNKALREGAQGYHPGENPIEFVHGLIEFPAMHECPEEMAFTYAVFSDEKYQKFVEPELAGNIVTLNVFHELLLGRFELAAKIRDEHSQHYNVALADQFVKVFVHHESFTEENSLEHLVAMQRSALRDLFPEDISATINQSYEEFDAYVEEHKDEISDDFDRSGAREKFVAGYWRLGLARKIADYLDENNEITPDDRMDEAVSDFHDEHTKLQYAQKRGLPYEKTTRELDIDKLHKAFDQSETRFGTLVGIGRLSELLDDIGYVEYIGRDTIKSVLNERTQKALQNGNAHSVYLFRFGTNIGHGHNIEGVPHFDEYVEVDKSMLLESMISAIDWDIDHLLNEYDFQFDNLKFDSEMEVDDAYDLYQAIQQEGGDLPSDESVRKIIFLKMAMHAKESYEGKGMKLVVGVFEDPLNAPYVDPSQAVTLITKVWDCIYFDGVHTNDGGIGHGGINHLQADRVSYFYTLASSSLGKLMGNDDRVAPYLKLHEFLES